MKVNKPNIFLIFSAVENAKEFLGQIGGKVVVILKGLIC